VMGALPRIIHHCRLRDALLMGAGLTVLANSRPFEGFILCIPVAVALAWWLFSSRNFTFSAKAGRVIAPLALVVVATLAFIGYYNWRVTGNALVMPHELYQRQQCNCPIFAWQKPYPPMRYANAQFDYYYNIHKRERSVTTLPAWWKRSWEGIKGCWHVFLGGILSIPLVTLPWVVRDRRMRLLLIQFLLSAAALLAIIVIEGHYLAPVLATAAAIWVQSMRHLRRWKLFGRPAGIALSRLVVLLFLVNVPWFVIEMVRGGHVKEQGWGNQREQIVEQLESTPGRHLVLVQYAPEPEHDVGDEWVYNAADIDGSKVVWAREIPGQNVQPLLNYFHDRKVWVVEADDSPPRLQAFEQQPAPQPASGP
jgi:hypothetical protein